MYIDYILFFFVSHATKGTQWTHPRTGKKKVVSGGEEYWMDLKLCCTFFHWRSTSTWL